MAFASQGGAVPSMRPSWPQAGPPAKRARIAPSGGTTATGEVRFADPAEAQLALSLSGSMIGDHTVEVELDSGSRDSTRITVRGLPLGYDWRDLKDFFAQCGTVKFADCVSSGGLSPSSGSTAEVRYDDAASAQNAATMLNGSILAGATLTVTLDTSSQDMTRLHVGNVPAGVEWQELKDHFRQCGSVAFVKTAGSSPGKGGGKGKGQLQPMQPMQQMQSQMQTQMQMQMMMQMMSQGAGKGCGLGGQANGGLTGEVRYESSMGAQAAAMSMNGTPLRGSPISVAVDETSRDLSKVWVYGIPFGTPWQELKEHMSWAGKVVFANVQ